MSCEPSRTRRYSEDIRWRIIWLRASQNLTYRKISQRLCIGLGTVARTLQVFRATGDVMVGKSPTHNTRAHLRKLDDFHEFFIIGLVLENTTVYLHELCALISRATNVEVSIPTVCRVLRRYGLTRKKVQRIALQRSCNLRALFMANSFIFHRRSFVWVDETGSDRRNFLRKYGYALKGHRAIKHTFLARGKRINSILAISSTGIVGRHLTEKSIDSGTFFDFIRGELLPNLLPFDGVNAHSIIVMDNLSVHHCDEIVNLLQGMGILVQFLPPYSPDMNPIEEAFSYIKHYLRLHEDVMEATNDPMLLINAAIDSITESQCNKWITDSGYGE